MKVRGTVRRVGLSGCAALALLGCSPDEVVVGERCPHPSSGRATIAGGQMAADGLYGTSCAPCDQNPPEYDDRGCPIYVTFESCGGNICLGGVEVELGDDDAGAAGAGGAGGADAGRVDSGVPDAGDGGNASDAGDARDAGGAGDAGDAGDASLPEEDAGAN